MSSFYNCSLVLASHGSTATTNANEPQFELARQIEGHGIFAKVVPAFLNGTPAIENVLDDLPPGDVVVVPLMTSEGYYSQTVFPDRLHANPRIAEYRVLLTPAIGTQAAIGEMLVVRIEEIIRQNNLPIDKTTVTIVGHGTRRNSKSGESTYTLAELLRATQPGLDVQVGFLDQDPEIGQIAKSVSNPISLVVPFLISRGPHTTVDLPEAFGLPTGPQLEFPLVQRIGDQIVWLDTPIGMYPEIADLVMRMAVDRLLHLPASCCSDEAA